MCLLAFILQALQTRECRGSRMLLLLSTAQSPMQQLGL